MSKIRLTNDILISEHNLAIAPDPNNLLASSSSNTESSDDSKGILLQQDCFIVVKSMKGSNPTARHSAIKEGNNFAYIVEAGSTCEASFGTCFGKAGQYLICQYGQYKIYGVK